LGRLGRPDGHGQLTPKGLCPAHGLGSLAPRLVPLADDLAKLQLLLLHLRLCQHHVAATSDFSSSQSSRRSATSVLRWARRSLASASTTFRDRSEPQTPLSRRMNNDLAVLIFASS
jgi:hypothetical protein